MSITRDDSKIAIVLSLDDLRLLWHTLFLSKDKLDHGESLVARGLMADITILINDRVDTKDRIEIT